MTKNKMIGIIVVLFVACVLVWSIGRALYRKFTHKAAESIDEIQKKMGVPVVVARPVRTNLAATLVLDAVIEPKERALVMSDADGSITRIHVDEGDRVKGGDEPTLLVELDDSAALARKQAAQAGFQDAQTNFEHAKKLLEKGGISQQDFDRASVVLKHMRADLVAAESELADCRIYSPIGGFVAKRHVDPGVVTSKGKLLMEIVDISGLKANIRIPEKKIRFINKDMKCRIRVTASNMNGPIVTQISTINPAIDSQTGELIATCDIGESHLKLVPGMFASAEVEYDHRESVTAVPDEAVVIVDGRPGVYVVDNEKTARFRVVKTGIRDKGYLEIVSGLSGDEMVIVEGNRQVSDGVRTVIAD